MNVKHQGILLGIFLKEPRFSGAPVITNLAHDFLSLKIQLQRVLCICFHPQLGRMTAKSVVLLRTNLYFVLTDVGFSFTQRAPIKGPSDFPGALAMLAKTGDHPKNKKEQKRKKSQLSLKIG